MIVKAANSPRPGNWVLERSLDGVDYKPWQYYAISDSECWNAYGVEPSIGIPKFERDDDVLCVSQYSRLDPLQGGEVRASRIPFRTSVVHEFDDLCDYGPTVNELGWVIFVVQVANLRFLLVMKLHPFPLLKKCLNLSPRTKIAL